MADVRGASGAPVLANFAGQTPTPSTPLYVDLSNGDLYVVVSEVPVKVGSVTANADLVITQQVFANHARLDQSAIGSADSLVKNMVFAPKRLPAMWI